MPGANWTLRRAGMPHERAHTFGEHVTPNEAAKQFIEALKLLWPGRFGEVKAC